MEYRQEPLGFMELIVVLQKKKHKTQGVAVYIPWIKYIYYTHTQMLSVCVCIYIYIYIYICVCVCVCVCNHNPSKIVHHNENKAFSSLISNGTSFFNPPNSQYVPLFKETLYGFTVHLVRIFSTSANWKFYIYNFLELNTLCYFQLHIILA